MNPEIEFTTPADGDWRHCYYLLETGGDLKGFCKEGFQEEVKDDERERMRRKGEG
jgi:hypothetical protein